MNFMRLNFLVLFMSLQVLPAQAALPLDEARKLYSDAIEHIRRGRISAAENLAPQLKDYALYPYLELELIKSQLNQLSSQTIDTYLQEYGNTIVGQRIRIAWVNLMVRRQDWPGFLRYYTGHGGDDMQCVAIRALRDTGQTQAALAKAGELWKTGHSLPDICDASLYFWNNSLSATEKTQQYWLRAELALEERQYSLAKYLLGKVSADPVYIELISRPSLLYHRHSSLPVNDHSRIIATHSLMRLARIDFDRANDLWHQIDRRLQLNPAQNYVLRDAMARQIIAGDADYARDWLKANDPDYEDPYLTEWRIRLALKDGDWVAIQRLISFLPPELENKADWRYWWARADIILQGEITATTREILKNLAAERGYYSFMAADLLDKPYQLAGQRTLIPALVSEVTQRSAIQRARELHWHEQRYTARLEWANAMLTLNRNEQVAAAQLAQDWGWNHQAIMTAIHAKEWDDLELRFPAPFSDEFKKAAKKRDLDLKWIYAIARQESAFAEDARSPVGARGLMQLMPGTARIIARKMGTTAREADLIVAEKNIAMGSYYLEQLMAQFGNNRILATAAYNAGPNRVERVLLRQEQDYPADIWIENLPYGETREYIKNVLAFSIIYGKKLDMDGPLLAKHERQIGPNVLKTAAKN
ncbi:transglycosylase family protein [Spongiibacter sp. IMCC21906]|nr:transglycosylase family protein [Spongiibacter sp. IMCC21906]